MKVAAILLVYLFISSGLLGQVPCSMDNLNWLEGNWKRTNSRINHFSMENWTKLNDSSLLGKGFTLFRADTVFSENLSIVVKNGGCIYVADVVENPVPVIFSAIVVDSTQLSFENKAHDFPNKIEYFRNEGGMKVMVSGKGRSFVYTFVKESVD